MAGNYKLSKSKFFVNPYNFVSVDLKNTKREDVTKEKEELLTGYMQCLMKCKTPIAIPDIDRGIPRSVRETDGTIKIHYEYPFMGMNGSEGEPRIPGSSIRGPIRNVYETLTNSCFGTMKNDTVITARGILKEKGLLIKEENQWKLYKAERHLLIIDKNFYNNHKLMETGVKLFSAEELRGRTGEKVYFELAQNEDEKKCEYKKKNVYIGKYVKQILQKDSKCGNTGYLCIGEEIQKRHFQSVFEKKELVRDCEITDLDLHKLEYILQCYRNNKINTQYKKGHRGYQDYEKSKKLGIIPVYYTFAGKKLYMSFAALGRKAFYNTLNNLAGEKAHQKCDGRNNLCPACALFGTIEGEKLGSRIRFTDAICSNATPDKFIEKVVFEELSSPKISYIPFYMKGNFKKLNDAYDSNELTIRGRKFYWHHKPVIEKSKNISRNDRNATFDVMDEETEFKFKVYFDGITNKELSLLAAAIDLYESNIDGKYCHKVGHGKPLGYGSVKIIIEASWIREFKFKEQEGWSWKVTPKDIVRRDDDFACSENTKQELLTICDFTKKFDAIVEYPEVVTVDELTEKWLEKKNDKNSIARHKWFTENKKIGATEPERKLPLLSQKQELEKREFKIYKARIISEGKQTSNKDYLDYDIRILECDEFINKKCVMNAPIKARLHNGYVVYVELNEETENCHSFKYK